MATSRRRLASGGAAWTQNGATMPGAAWTDPSLWVPQAPSTPAVIPYTAPSNSSGTQGGSNASSGSGGNGGRGGTATASPSGTGGYMPTVSTVASDMGINPTYGKVAQAVLSTLAPPLGMAMTGYGVVAQANNTANNSAMLGRMGDPLGFGQIAGGVLGLNGYGGTPEGAMNSAMATPAGRAALSPSQLGGENPGVSMPTQTAPVTPVSSQQLGAPRGLSSDNGGTGDSGGGAARGYGAVANGTAVGSQNSSNDPTGMGGMAHGGQVRGSARGKPNTNVIIVMPHPVMGALMMAALHNRMQPQHLATGALPARRR